DEVRPEQAPVGVALAGLLDEVAVLDHPGELDDALQLHLAPAPAHVWRPERRDQVAGLLPQPVLALGDGPEQLGDRADLLHPLLLERARLLLVAVERLADRLELELGEPEEILAAPFERVTRERLEVLVPESAIGLDRGEPLVAPAHGLARPQPDGGGA